MGDSEGASKERRMSTSEPKQATGQDAMWADMRAMMEGLLTKMDDVKTDIGSVRRKLGDQIAAGNRETLELKKRMDENDRTFADRVMSVIAGLPGGPRAAIGEEPVPVFSDAGQSLSLIHI